MKSHLVQAASEVIPNQQILVNMVSRRVRQLCLGHRPMVEFVPGLGHADVALSEIAAASVAAVTRNDRFHKIFVCVAMVSFVVYIGALFFELH